MAYIPKKKQQIDPEKIFDSAFDQFISKKFLEQNANDKGIIGIENFCNDWLSIDLNKYEKLRVILKMYYYNTLGNENMEITDEDIKVIESISNYGQGLPWVLEKIQKLKMGEIDKPFQTLVLALGRRSGKCQPLTSNILTPTGWEKMGDIRVGDLVITKSGKPTEVTAIYPQGKKKIYKIVMSDGSSTECCDEHLWETTSYVAGETKKTTSVKTTMEIMQSIFCPSGSVGGMYNHSIPLVNPVEFDSHDVPIDPYIFGCLLADNELACSSEFPIDIYKFNSVDVRLEVLRGLMDTGRSEMGNNGEVTFRTMSSRLAEDVKFIVQSLGGICIVATEFENDGLCRTESKEDYVLHIELPHHVNSFKFSIKANAYAEFASKSVYPNRFITSVEYLGQKEAQCIQVADPSHLYVTDDFIVTHNTFTASVVICYEIYKLLAMIVCPKCEDAKPVKSGEACPDCGTICSNHPQAYYGLRGSEPLRVLLAATRLEQAVDPGFNFCKERIMECPFFDGKFYFEQECAYFKTEYDLRVNERLRSLGQPELKGSIVLKPISSNSSGAHGTGAVTILLDEFALFNSEGKDTDIAILEALKPQTLLYRKKHNDGRIIMISMPDKEEGQFHGHFVSGTSSATTNVLSFQIPTWEFNPNYTEDDCRELATGETEAEGLAFDKLYGAQFAADGGDVYLPEESVKKAYSNHTNFQFKKQAYNPHHRYFMHIDCAFTSANYAYVVLHPEKRTNEAGQEELVFVQDDAHFWKPSINEQGKFLDLDNTIVSVNDILQTIARRAKAFRVVSLSYDMMQSLESIAFFRKNGLPVKQLSFSGYKKAEIYGVLKTAIMQDRYIGNMEDDRGKRELIGLRQTFTKRGPQIEPTKSGAIKTKDVADCIAGACYMCVQRSGKKFVGSISINPISTGLPSPSALGGRNQSIFGRTSLLKGYKGGI